MAKQGVSFRLAALIVVLCVSLAGCTVARIYATSGNQVSLTETNPAGGEQFTIHHRLVFDYTGAIDVQELLRERYGSGHEFQNVTVKLKSDGIDFLLNLVTFGLAQSRSVEITGDKVRRARE